MRIGVTFISATTAISYIALLWAFTGIPAFAADASSSTSRVVAPYEQSGFEAGVILYITSADYSSSDDLSQKLNVVLDRLVGDHVNAISLVWPIYTGDVTSSSIFAGQGTPSDGDLKNVIEGAHSRGFIVTMRPVIDEHSLRDAAQDWRGTIRPADPAKWFNEYTAMMLQYSSLAEEERVHAFVIGAELNSMEKYHVQWSKLIAAVRNTFHGEISYSGNQGFNMSIPWHSLDYVGIDAFFALDTPDEGATVSDMLKAEKTWVDWAKRVVMPAGKPLILAEVGSESEHNAHKKSWLWDHGTAVDLADQANFYQAVCEAWKPFVTGMYWWSITLNPPADPSGDGSFTPWGKPAETQMADCYAS